MARILKDFKALEAYLASCGRGCRGGQQGDLGAHGHRQYPECADRIVDFIGHLQHPFHGVKCRRGGGHAP